MTAAGPLPVDIRLMNGVALAVYAAAALALLAAALLWVLRSPAFPVRSIRIEGDLQRNSLSTVRANALPRLAGNFFATDLQAARAAFEAVPWVRQAVVRRVWPDRLAVRLQEHRPAAVWIGLDSGNGSERLVNSFGEVFEANVGDVEDDNLPELAGPDGSSAQMLAMMQRVQPLFLHLKRELRQLSLSGRGSWRAELEGDVIVELGRGSDDEVFARTERFVRTLGQVTQHYRSPLIAADLRHADGYAVRLRGLSTEAPAPRSP
jgi:cell division protein FtsQ